MTTSTVHWNFPLFHWDNPYRVPYVKQSDAPASATHTGGTTSTSLANISFAANEINAGDCIRVRALFESDNDTNDDDLLVWVGAINTGTNSVLNNGTPTGNSYQFDVDIWFNSTTSCVSHFKNMASFATGTVAPTAISLNLDTTAGFDIDIGTELGNAASTVTLHGYTVTVIKSTEI